MISEEDIQSARKQLSEQVEGLPEGPQKEAAREQLERMSDETISAMVEQQRKGTQNAGPQKGIFRMIVDGDIPAKRIDENKDAIAVVSKRAISRGHVLVIPKKVVGDAKSLPSGALSMAKKIAGKIISKLKANRTEIQTSNAFGEAVINVIPIYEKPLNVNSEAYEAKEGELEEVYLLLRVVKKPKREIIRRKRAPVEILRLRRPVP
jgi:hypothetical protein